MRSRRTAVVAALAGTVLAVSGCGPFAGSRHEPSTSATPSASTGLGSTTFTVADGDSGKATFHFTVTALYRSGDFTRIGFTVGCDAKTTADSCDTTDAFGGGTFDTYGGIALVDPVGHKEYPTVQDHDSRVFTSVAEGIDPGKSAQGWAVFPGTPAGAKQLDVALPSGGRVIQDVPVGQPKPQTQSAPIGDFAKPKDTTDASGLRLTVRPLRLHTTSEGTDEQQQKGRANVTLSADVLFAFGKATLTDKAKTILRRQVTKLDATATATGPVDVTGYTDAKGSPKVNDPLSKNRAKAVADYLRTQAQRDFSYTVTGRGEANPVAPNTKPDGSDNPAGRAKNRRVTVSYRTQPPKRQPTSSSSSGSAQQPKQPQPVDWTTGSTDQRGTYRVVVRDLHRHGDLAVMRVSVTCTEANSSSGCWSLYDLKDRANNRAGGFRLYERPSKTTEYPVIDSDDKELTTAVPDNIGVGQGEEYWIYFPAPDPGVTAVDVTLPQGGPTVHDVPVS